MIELRNVTKEYSKGHAALNGVSVKIERGEFVFIVGDSGSGKSTLIKLIMKELNPTEGTIIVNGQNLNRMKHRNIAKYRRGLGVVFQDFRLLKDRSIYENIAFALRVTETPTRVIKKKVPAALSLVGLAQKYKSFPKELSGGEQQRVAIARAIVNEPAILLADEPTTALDATVQIQILILLREQQKQRGLSIVFVTHDIGAAVEIADRVAVMYAGRIVEEASMSEILRHPRHPYTQALLRALPEFAQDKARLASLPGVVPGKYDRPVGCLLNPRCPYATDKCRSEEPALADLTGGRQSKCHYPLDDAGRPGL